MASQHLEPDKTSFAKRQELIELVTKLVSDSHGTHQNTQDDMLPDPAAEQRRYPARHSETDVSCVKELLANHLQHVYRFRADDHDAQINGQPSFATLVSHWDAAPTPRPWNRSDLHDFPNVRNGRGFKVHTACTVQCSCTECVEGGPMELVCESYRFGRAKGQLPQILVHQLRDDLENRAIVLGCGSEPDTYLIWGTHPTLPDTMAYNQNIVLRQVHCRETEPSLPLRGREHPKRRRASNSTDSASEVHKQPETNHHQQLAGAQQPVQPGLQQAYRVVRDHVIAQRDQDTGLSIMFSNHKILDLMKNLEVSAQSNNAWLFRTMREMIDEQLSKAGFVRLPGMQEEL